MFFNAAARVQALTDKRMDSILRYSTILVAHVVLIVSMYAEYGSANHGSKNNYQVKQVNSFDQIVPSIEAAVRWLKEQEKTESAFLSPVGLTDSDRFASIQQLINYRKCDGSDIDEIIAYENSYELQRLHSNYNDAHVYRMMVRSFEEHAEKCQEVYQGAYKVKEKQLDRLVVARVEILAETIMESDRYLTSELDYYQAENLFYRYIGEPVSVDYYFGTNIFKFALISNARNERNLHQSSNEYQIKGFGVDSEDAIRNLVLKYLIEPCQIYVDELGPDVFIPARYDARYYYSIDKTQFRYYLGWSYFMICQAITMNKEAVILDVVESFGFRKIIPSDSGYAD